MDTDDDDDFTTKHKQIQQLSSGDMLTSTQQQLYSVAPLPVDLTDPILAALNNLSKSTGSHASSASAGLAALAKIGLNSSMPTPVSADANAQAQRSAHVAIVRVFHQLLHRLGHLDKIFKARRSKREKQFSLDDSNAKARWWWFMHLSPLQKSRVALRTAALMLNTTFSAALRRANIRRKVAAGTLAGFRSTKARALLSASGVGRKPFKHLVLKLNEAKVTQRNKSYLKPFILLSSSGDSCQN